VTVPFITLSDGIKEKTPRWVKPYRRTWNAFFFVLVLDLLLFEGQVGRFLAGEVVLFFLYRSIQTSLNKY
jgi:hypothetical protein